MSQLSLGGNDAESGGAGDAEVKVGTDAEFEVGRDTPLEGVDSDAARGSLTGVPRQLDVAKQSSAIATGALWPNRKRARESSAR